MSRLFGWLGAGRPRTDIAKRVAPTRDAGVGRNLHHHDIERRNRRGALPEARHPGIVGDADVMGPDVGDQHGFPSRTFAARQPDQCGKRSMHDRVEVASQAFGAILAPVSVERNKRRYRIAGATTVK